MADCGRSAEVDESLLGYRHPASQPDARIIAGDIPNRRSGIHGGSRKLHDECRVRDELPRRDAELPRRTRPDRRNDGDVADADGGASMKKAVQIIAVMAMLAIGFAGGRWYTMRGVTQ